MQYTVIAVATVKKVRALHSCANAQARATLVPMTQVPNLANLNLGIPTAGAGKKGRTDEKKGKKELILLRQQMVRNLSRNREIFVESRNVSLALGPSDRLETPEQIKAFLVRVAGNEYLNAFVQHELKKTTDDAWYWATHMWDWHRKICEHMRLGGRLKSEYIQIARGWDPPTYPLAMDDVIKDKIIQAVNTLYPNYIARTGPDGGKRSTADIYKMLNDPAYADLLMMLTNDALLEVLHKNDDLYDIPFLVQTRDYWVDLEQRVRALEYARGRPRGPVVAKEEQEQVLPPCALPPCIRTPPRPVAGVEEQEEEEEAEEAEAAEAAEAARAEAAEAAAAAVKAVKAAAAKQVKAEALWMRGVELGVEQAKESGMQDTEEGEEGEEGVEGSEGEEDPPDDDDLPLSFVRRVGELRT